MIWPVFAVFLPLLFVLVVWAVVTACRLLLPEEPEPFTSSDAVVRAASRRPVQVGAREIRADIRFRQRHETSSYSYADHASGGLPETWCKDVSHRLN